MIHKSNYFVYLILYLSIAGLKTLKILCLAFRYHFGNCLHGPGVIGFVEDRTVVFLRSHVSINLFIYMTRIVFAFSQGIICFSPLKFSWRKEASRHEIYSLYFKFTQSLW